MQWRVGTIRSERARWGSPTTAVEYAVELAPVGDGPDAVVRALAYTALVGEPQPGDTVLLNASALLRGLGTGGLAFVVAVPDRLPPDGDVGAGHIVKARYTPQQQMLMAVDEQDSPHHQTLRDAEDLGGLPVVTADLHSALPAVLAGIRAEREGLRVAYVMTDGGALPAAFSRAVAGLTEAGWLCGTITVGQAFGGDHEAVTVHSGLLAARHVLRADITVVAQGPGNVGTGTPWGFSGVAAGEALNAAHVLGGRPVAALRVSASDARGRHTGVSHHSRTAYGRVALVPADLVTLPVRSELDTTVLAAAHEMVALSEGRLRVVEVEATGLRESLATSPVPLSTMGRGMEQDAAPFLYSAAAGRYAARLLDGA